MLEIKYIGHSAFQISKEDKSLLVDPWVSINKNYNWHNEPITDIFVTHGHGDHLGNSIEISKEKNAPITAIFEIANYCKTQGATVKPIGMGAWKNFTFGKAVFVPAFHSSSLPDGRYGGTAAGIIFDIDGVKIYHAGDTALTGEMKTIKELYAPQIAILPIGGTYTMDIEHASIAAQWLGAKTVIPMHYNTFPEVNADVEKFKESVCSKGIDCKVIPIGESINF